MFGTCTSLLQVESCTTRTVDPAITKTMTFSCLVCTRLVIHLVCTCGLPLFLRRARSLIVPSLDTKITAIEAGANDNFRNLIRPVQTVHESVRSLSIAAGPLRISFRWDSVSSVYWNTHARRQRSGIRHGKSGRTFCYSLLHFARD